MTQEEKAKAYDEIVNKAESMHKMACETNYENTRMALENLFPELAESEDERMLKCLISYLHGDEDECDYNIPEMLAWLEKQKEEISAKPEALKKAYEKSKEDALKEQKPLSIEETELNSIAFLEQLGYTCIPPSEQKSAENPFDANETMKMKDRIDEGFTKMMMQKQKPAEWSERDKKMMNEIITMMEGGKVTSGTDLCEYAYWLKSLPERFNLQSKQEWNEEDERMRQTAIEACKTVAEDYENSNARFWKCKDWLEYRLKSLRPHWKPSEEQMEVFLKANPVNLMPGDLFVYKSLCNDIQKLM